MAELLPPDPFMPESGADDPSARLADTKTAPGAPSVLADHITDALDRYAEHTGPQGTVQLSTFGGTVVDISRQDLTEHADPGQRLQTYPPPPAAAAAVRGIRRILGRPSASAATPTSSNFEVRLTRPDKTVTTLKGIRLPTMAQSRAPLPAATCLLP